MKKNCLIAISVFIISPIFSQEKGISDIKLGYSIGITSNGFIKDLAYIGGVAIGEIFGGVSNKENVSNNNFYIGYQYTVKDRLMIGSTFAYQRIEDKWLSDENITFGESKNVFYTVASDLDYHYVFTNFFQMYSGVGVAYTFNQNNFIAKSSTIKSKNERDGYFNYQLDLLGFRVGKALAGFLELGFGYKGIVSVGISYQF